MGDHIDVERIIRLGLNRVSESKKRGCIEHIYVENEIVRTPSYPSYPTTSNNLNPLMHLP